MEDREGVEFRLAVLMVGSAPLVKLDEEMASTTLAEVDEITLGGAKELITGAELEGKEHVVRIPTLHVHGLKDPGIVLHWRLLDEFCEAGTTHFVEWEGITRLLCRSLRSMRLRVRFWL